MAHIKLSIVEFLPIQFLPQSLRVVADEVPVEEIAKLKAARVELVLIPRGVGKLDIVVPNLFKEVEQDEPVVLKFNVLNSGTLLLRRVTPEIDLPLEWVPVSSGAKIAMDSGTENLDATARVVRRIVTFTQSGGVVHVIVQGVNVGAQSYFDALATMLVHTRGVLVMTPRASMVLTGRAALEASGSVSAEDEVAIGGFEQIMGPNGQAQYYARNLTEAYRLLYDYYRYSYVVPGEFGPRRL